jgi:hypothetical protein
MARHGPDADCLAWNLRLNDHGSPTAPTSKENSTQQTFVALVGDEINFSKEKHSSVAGIWHDEVKGKIAVNLFDPARRNYMREVWLALEFADQFGRLWPSRTFSTMSRRAEGRDY